MQYSDKPGWPRPSSAGSARCCKLQAGPAREEWEIDPDDIIIAKDEEGRDLQLGSGGFGKATPCAACKNSPDRMSGWNGIRLASAEVA